jgi:hypothetical protein
LAYLLLQHDGRTAAAKVKHLHTPGTNLLLAAHWFLLGCSKLEVFKHDNACCCNRLQAGKLTFPVCNCIAAAR